MADHESEYDKGQRIISESESQVFIIKNCEVEIKEEINPNEIEIPIGFEFFSRENINENEAKTEKVNQIFDEKSENDPLDITIRKFYKCDYCDYEVCTNLEGFRTHIKNMHRFIDHKDKHKCGTCNFIFEERQLVLKKPHVTIHKCVYCEQLFRKILSLCHKITTKFRYYTYTHSEVNLNQKLMGTKWG